MILVSLTEVQDGMSMHENQMDMTLMALERQIIDEMEIKIKEMEQRQQIKIKEVKDEMEQRQQIKIKEVQEEMQQQHMELQAEIERMKAAGE